MSKKLLVIICSLCMLVSLVGCGGNNNDTTPKSSSETQSSLTQSTQQSTEQSVQQSTPQSSATVEYESVEISTANATKVYFEGSKISTAGIFARVKVNGLNSTLPANKLDIIIPNNASELGKHTIVVKVGSYESSFDINVIKKPVVSNNEIKIKVDTTYTGAMSDVDSLGYSQFASLNDAFTALKGAFDDAVVKTIQLCDQTYNEKVSFNIKNVHIYGVKGGSTKISYGDCADTAGGTDNSATFTCKGEGLWVTDVIFENSYDYLNDKTYSNKQAVAALIEADKCVFNNCTFLGYQDTLEPKAGRQYYKNCTIKGCIDYIFGKNATALFETCNIVTLYRPGDEYCITAHMGNNGNKGQGVPTYGYVFKNCVLSVEGEVGVGRVTLGRPWRADATVAWINCEMSEHISKSAYGESGVRPRYNSMEGGGANNLPQDAHFVEFGNTGLGAMNEAVLGFTMAQNADDYTLANIFATTNGLVTYTGEFNAQQILQGLMA